MTFQGEIHIADTQAPVIPRASPAFRVSVGRRWLLFVGSKDCSLLGEETSWAGCKIKEISWILERESGRSLVLLLSFSAVVESSSGPRAEASNAKLFCGECPPFMIASAT
jgi:hypothetical protein